MTTINFFNCFFADVMNKVHNLGSDTLKIALTDNAPLTTYTTLSNIVQISSGNGYTTGGQALDNVTSTQTLGVYSLKADDETFAASGGAMTQFRYGVLYNDTASGDPLIAYWDNGSEVNLASGEQFKFDWPSGVIFTYQIDT